MTSVWPELAYEGWKDTLDTLHRWTQVVGKIALACSPRQNHWWNVGLHLTATGLRTGVLQRPDGQGAFDLTFDFVDHRLQLRTQSGAHQTLPLVACSVATFHDAVFEALQRAGIQVSIRDEPAEIAVDALPLSQDELHRSYDPEAVERFFTALSLTGQALERFNARFVGKVSLVLFWWGTFDVSVSRYSGRPAPPRKGADSITREAYSHEVSSVGFWPGDPSYRQPAFFGYTAPAPDGYGQLPVEPAEASFSQEKGLFLLSYDAVRDAAAPEAMLSRFFQTTYEAGADAGGWDRQALERQDAAPLGGAPVQPTVH